jgi:hypothetical protein
MLAENLPLISNIIKEKCQVEITKLQEKKNNLSYRILTLLVWAFRFFFLIFSELYSCALF